MSDYNNFYLKTHSFIKELKSVSPSISSRQLQNFQFNLQEFDKLRFKDNFTGKTPANLVGELRLIFNDLPKKNIPSVLPVLKHYLKTIQAIKLDTKEDIKLRHEISLFMKDFKEMGIHFDDIEIQNLESKINFGFTMPKFSRRAAFKDSMLLDYSSISPIKGTLPEPALRVRLSGDRVKGRTIECGKNCVLSIDWGVPDGTTIGELIGNELQRARETKLEVVFVLYRGLFELDGNKSRIATRFNDEGFETPVIFSLIAPEAPIEKSDIYLEIEIHGRPAVRVRISLTIVHDISSLSIDSPPTSVKIDLDKLIANAKRLPPAAILRIISSAVPSAELMIIKTGDIFTSRQDALTQLSIANQLGTIAMQMDKVAQDSIWNILADPLKPTADELPWLSEPLARAASAGSELHEWLAITAGMKDILSCIDNLSIGSRIIVRSDGVAIPWETIYPDEYRLHHSNGDYKTAVDPTKFWGYRFEFETIMSPGQRELPEGDTDRTEQHRISVRKLTAVMNEEIDSERTWKAGRPVDYQLDAFSNARGKALAEIQIKTSCSEARMLVEKEPTSGPFVYFYCHGSATKPFDPDVAVLQITSQCRIAVGDVMYKSTFIDAPIVFLNSCSSGPLSSVSFDSFCARFLFKGALGLITTSFGVPAPFAARFGCELILRYMRAEETLGEILLDMRKKALDQRIPIGLFYILRCPADVSLKPT